MLLETVHVMYVAMLPAAKVLCILVHSNLNERNRAQLSTFAFAKVIKSK